MEATMSNLRIKALAPARPAVARAARAFLTGQVATQTKTNHHDLVSDWDHRIEEQLKAHLADDDAVFWGEETGRQPVSAPGQLEWIIDPIDGTSNFVHGYPMFSLSIAAAVGQRVVAAVGLDPVSGDEFSADATGAYLNDAPLETRPAPQQVSQYNLVTSFPAGEILQRAPQATEVFGQLVTEFATVRRLVSGALEICYAARGIADIVLGVDASPWDVAAASYILTRAGGTYLTGSDGPAHLAPHYVAVAPGRSAEVVSEVFTRIHQM